MGRSASFIPRTITLGTMSTGVKQSNSGENSQCDSHVRRRPFLTTDRARPADRLIWSVWFIWFVLFVSFVRSVSQIDEMNQPNQTTVFLYQGSSSSMSSIDCLSAVTKASG